VTKLVVESIDAVVLVGLVVQVVQVQLGLGLRDLRDLLVVAVVAVVVVATILVNLPVDLLVVVVVVANRLAVMASRLQDHRVHLHLHLHHRLHHLLAMARGLCLEVVECLLMDESNQEWGMVVDCSAACRRRNWHVPWLHMLGCLLLVFDCFVVGSIGLC
jgi:hypothetical protein